MKEKPTYRLENWAIAQVFGTLRASGNVYARSDMAEGEFIFTSRVLEIDEAVNKLETCNSIYILGKKAANQ